MKVNAQGDIPSNRENAFIFHDSKSDLVYMFGGHNGTDLNDIYTFNPNISMWEK